VSTRQLLDQILQEVHAVSAREWKRSTTDRNISVIITSPNQITPYHMDADCNYLLQIAGAKTIYVFNGADKVGEKCAKNWERTCRLSPEDASGSEYLQ